MPAFDVNTSKIVWKGGKGNRYGGSFQPSGKLVSVGVVTRTNPVAPLSNKALAARILVGLKVGKRRRWKMVDLVNLVKSERMKKKEDPSASFLAQEGLFMHRDGKTLVHEKGAQVLIVNAGGAPKKFRADMVELAETICRRFKQESVMLDMQQGGVTKALMMVTA